MHTSKKMALNRNAEDREALLPTLKKSEILFCFQGITIAKKVRFNSAHSTAVSIEVSKALFRPHTEPVLYQSVHKSTSVCFV